MKALLLIMLFVGQVSAQHSHGTHENHSKVTSKRVSLKLAQEKGVQNILKKNDELFNAFLKKDPQLVEKKAISLHQELMGSSVKVLQDTQKQAKSLLAIKASADNEKNLAAYESFLQPLIALVKTHDVGSKFNIFYCPMIKKYWIQDTGVNPEVRNVFAMYMLECGTQETKF